MDEKQNEQTELAAAKTQEFPAVVSPAPNDAGQFSAAQGIGRWHQFGSPARLYVRAGNKIVVSGGANATFGLFAAAIGYFVDA